MPVKTTDLCDAHGSRVQVAAPIFRDFGGRVSFHGPIATVRAPEDNSLVRAALEEPGRGRVLVVDGAGSTRCALLGDQLAALGASNGWSGVVVFGCVRDAALLREIDLGVKALAATPKKSEKRGLGERDMTVQFAEVEFAPGAYLYADEDGVVVSGEPLLGESDPRA
jgi:regulator of ribonuclease activity A